VELPDDLLGRLKTGDLILASDQYQPVSEMDDVRGPQWSKLGMVVRPSDFGVTSGDQDEALLVYSPEQGKLCAVDDLVARLPEQIETVVVCELDPGSTGQAVEQIAGRVGAERLRTDPIGDRFRDALRQAQMVSRTGALPGWEQYRQPTPLASRTCRYDDNPRPCPIHG
jgi:hypothetical protein